MGFNPLKLEQTPIKGQGRIELMMSTRTAQRDTGLKPGATRLVEPTALY